MNNTNIATTLNMTHKIAARHIRGLGLIELLIAMTLGLVILGAVSWVYLNTSRTYKLQDAAARLQEGARFAFEALSNDLRMAGTVGCGINPTVGFNLNLLNSNTDWEKNLFGQPLVALDTDATNVGDVNEVSDAIRVLRADIANEYIVSSHNTGAAQFTLTAAHNLTAGQYMVATDCNYAAVFQVTTAAGSTVDHAASGTPGNSSTNLGTAYAAGSRIYPLRALTYYITNNPAGVPSLYRMRPMGSVAALTAEELIEGVDDLQVSFAVDTTTPNADGIVDFLDPDGDGDPYLTATQIEDPTSGVPGATSADRWKRVKSARISLVLRTVEDNVTSEFQTYNFNGASVTATDHRLRKVFTHVVKMRNL